LRQRLLSGFFEVPADDGLSGSADQFDRMVDSRIAQVTRLTGTVGDNIAVLERIQTGGGRVSHPMWPDRSTPVVRKPTISVMVFSQLAN